MLEQRAEYLSRWKPGTQPRGGTEASREAIRQRRGYPPGPSSEDLNGAFSVGRWRVTRNGSRLSTSSRRLARVLQGQAAGVGRAAAASQQALFFSEICPFVVCFGEARGLRDMACASEMPKMGPSTLEASRWTKKRKGLGPNGICMVLPPFFKIIRCIHLVISQQKFKKFDQSYRHKYKHCRISNQYQ
jgi:hypothetical protein